MKFPLKRVVSKRDVLLVLTGFLLGMIVTFMSHSKGSSSQRAFIRGLESGSVMDVDAIRKAYHAPENDLHWTDDHHHQDGAGSAAALLYKRVRVLCWVMTSPETIQSRARHVKATWGRRCNVLLFMSSFPDDALPAIALPVPEGYSFLWGKTRAALSHIARNYIEQAEWFLKADDDTYVIVENLRHMMAGFDAEKPHYFGRHWKTEIENGYMSGGAGYVLSKAALLRLVDKGFRNPNLCSDVQRGMEDVELGRCLQNIGVPTGDSRDAEGRERFHPFDPRSMLIPGFIPNETWYFQYNANPTKEGPACCSDNSISFHYMDPDWMYLMEFFVYHLNPYGLPHNGPPGGSSRDGASQNLLQPQRLFTKGHTVSAKSSQSQFSPKDRKTNSVK